MQESGIEVTKICKQKAAENVGGKILNFGFHLRGGGSNIPFLYRNLTPPPIPTSDPPPIVLFGIGNSRGGLGRQQMEYP